MLHSVCKNVLGMPFIVKEQTFGATIDHRDHSFRIKHDTATIFRKFRFHLFDKSIAHPLPGLQVVKTTDNQVKLLIKTFLKMWWVFVVNFFDETIACTDLHIWATLLDKRTGRCIWICTTYLYILYLMNFGRICIAFCFWNLIWLEYLNLSHNHVSSHISAEKTRERTQYRWTTTSWELKRNRLHQRATKTTKR